MNNLIRLTEDGALLSASTAKKIAKFKRDLEKVEALRNELYAELLLEMETRGIIKAVSEDVIINYIPATTRETFDTKAFRKAHPDLYDQYAKLSPVKASVRVKVVDHD